MGRRRPLVAALIFVLCSAGCRDGSETKPEDSPKTEADGRRPPDDVLILGDSISVGYYPHVVQDLSDIAWVHRPPGNHRSTWEALAHLDRWLGDRDWKVIHFNFGLHDVHRSTLEQYEANLTRIVERLKTTGATLVFATSTPVLAGTPGFSGGESVAYNEVARAVMERSDVAIDDLHSFARLHPEYQMPGDLHFTELGYRMLGKRVASAIHSARTGSHLKPDEESPADDRINYFGVWSLEKTGGLDGRHRMVSTDPHAGVSFSFLGSGLVIYREHSRRGGAMRLCVDEDCRTVDNHFAGDFGSQPHGIQGLEDGPHTVRISNLGGGFIDIGGVRVYGLRNRVALTPGRYSDDHRGILYFGSWIRQERGEHPPPEGGYVSTSLDPEAGARIPFEGTGIVVFRGIYDDRLETSLCIVGGRCARQSGFSDALFWGQPTMIAGLPFGTHEAEFRMLSGRAFDVESVEIIGEVQPLPAGRHDAKHAEIRYFGHWNETELELGGGAKAPIHQSRSPRATVYLPFEGDSLALRVVEASDRGSLEVCVDERCEVFSTGRPGAIPQLVWKHASGFGSGVHHALLRKVDGRYLDLAEVDVGSAP